MSSLLYSYISDLLLPTVYRRQTTVGQA